MVDLDFVIIMTVFVSKISGTEIIKWQKMEVLK